MSRLPILRCRQVAAPPSLVVVGAILASALCGSPLRAQRMTLLRLDHVIVGGDTLERLVADFERRTGVRPVYGGRHPGHGTQNALVRLGDHTYLELIAPAHDSATDEVRSMYAAFTGAPVVGFALGSDSLERTGTGLAARDIRIGSINPGARRTPAGARLSWRAAALPPLGLPINPFLIQWGAGSPHPSGSAPAGCTIASLEIRTPADTLARDIALLMSTPPTVRRAAKASLTLVIECPKGRVTF